MSLSTNIGLRALLTSQNALDSIGHNVANANTEGYSRQNLQISNSRPQNLRGLQLGNGVRVAANTSPWASPVSASTPLGMSTASTGVPPTSGGCHVPWKPVP